jgi:hypothetical protein
MYYLELAIYGGVLQYDGDLITLDLKRLESHEGWKWLGEITVTAQGFAAREYVW